MSCCELGGEPSVSIKSRNFLDLLVDFWAVMKDTAALVISANVRHDSCSSE